MGMDAGSTILFFLTGGISDLAKIVSGKTSSNNSKSTPQPTAQPDYSEATKSISDDSSSVAKAQIMSMEFQTQQVAADRDLKRSADLELTLEKFDTGLQTGKLGYQTAMKSEENRHQEQLTALHAQHSMIEKNVSDSFADIPPPMFD